MTCVPVSARVFWVTIPLCAYRCAYVGNIYLMTCHKYRPRAPHSVAFFLMISETPSSIFYFDFMFFGGGSSDLSPQNQNLACWGGSWTPKARRWDTFGWKFADVITTPPLQQSYKTRKKPSPHWERERHKGAYVNLINRICTSLICGIRGQFTLTLELGENSSSLFALIS